MRSRIAILLIFTLSVSHWTLAQPILGFWKVDKVKVGDRILTPVAKWFKYHEDNTYQAGNGWTQNDIGTWKYDKMNKTFLPESQSGKDEYGAFKVEFSKGKMTWNRTEDGVVVLVTLSKTEVMPIAPKDRIAGNWELLSVMKSDQNITLSYEAGKKDTMFIRWTQTYRRFNRDGSISNGYWYMDPHRTEFHLIDFSREVGIEKFNISFQDDLLIMESQLEELMIFTYKRI